MTEVLPFDSARLLIGGAWRPAASGGTLMLTNPSDGSDLAPIARGAAVDIDAAVDAAEAALAGDWGRLTAVERGRLLAAVGRGVLEQVDMLARLEALDVGKPLKQGPCRRHRAGALLRVLRRRGGQAARPDAALPNGSTALTLREPHGVTGHIVPWNYPMQIVGRSVGAALAMGNACVLKPAEEACLTVLAFARICAAAGAAGRGLERRHPGSARRRGAALAAHPRVRHLSFTGSVATGTAVQAAAARHVVPVTLELGGKSPQIVFADADPRCGAAVPGQRRAAERRTDLLGGLAHPGRAPGSCRGARAHGRTLSRPAHRAGACRPRPRPADLEAPAAQRRALPRARAR